MKLTTLAAACAALVSLSAQAALAADAVVAKLDKPVAERTTFIAGGAVFICKDDACVANVPVSETLATSTCKAVVSKVGAVSAFAGRRSLTEAQLSDCNGAVVVKAAAPAIAR